MKRKLPGIIVLIVSLNLLIAILSSCSGVNKPADENSPNNPAHQPQTNCPQISPETAVLIAKGYLYTDYELSDRETRVETETEHWFDKGEMWKITFYRTKDRDSIGGDPIVWIFKSNGERFTVQHAK